MPGYFRRQYVDLSQYRLLPLTSRWLLPPIFYTRPSPQIGGSAPLTIKRMIGNPALKAIAEFINKMTTNLCNRTFTQ